MPSECPVCLHRTGGAVKSLPVQHFLPVVMLKRNYTIGPYIQLLQLRPSEHRAGDVVG